MEKKFAEDDEFGKLLEEQFEEEVRIMEMELFSEEDLQGDASPGEAAASYEKLVERLKADGIYREDGEAGENGEKPAPEKRRFPVRFRSAAKAAGFLLVCVIGVFAASMTSEGNRKYVVETFRYITGDERRSLVGNDEKNEDVDENEYQAINDIRSRLGIEVPEFFYRPGGFEYQGYSIQEIMRVARLEYIYHDNIIVLVIDGEEENLSSVSNIVHGENVEIVTTEFDNIAVAIKESIDDGESSYAAEWKRNDAVYYISGKMEKSEFLELIRNIGYPI